MNELERKRIGDYVRARRMHLFGTVDAARIAAGVSRGAWDSVEQGKPARDFTYAAIEKALDVPSGRLATVAERGTPKMEVAINSSDPEAQVVEVPGRDHPYRLLLLDGNGVPVSPSDQEAYAAAVKALVDERPGELLALLAAAGMPFFQDKADEMSEAPERVLRVANKGDVEPEDGALTDP